MLEWFMVFAQLCDSAIATGKILHAWQDSQLTEYERKMLPCISKQGVVFLVEDDLHGRHVVSSEGHEFTDEDPAVTAKYLDAFARLCDRGLMMHQGGETFRLTGQGFDIARKIAGKG
jgi:hypothetical protein